MILVLKSSEKNQKMRSVSLNGFKNLIRLDIKKNAVLKEVVFKISFLRSS